MSEITRYHNLETDELIRVAEAHSIRLYNRADRAAAELLAELSTRILLLESEVEK